VGILVGFEPQRMKFNTFSRFGKAEESFWIKTIKYNAAKLGLAELCLNSMWRNLCENPRKTQTTLISDPQKLYRFLATPGIEVTNLLFAGDDVVWISWQHAEEVRVANLRHTNDLITAG